LLGGKVLEVVMVSEETKIRVLDSDPVRSTF